MLGNLLFGIQNVATFVLLALPGYFAKKSGLAKSEHIDGFSRLLINFLWPCMVIDVMSAQNVTSDSLKTSVIVLSVSLAIFVVTAAFGFGYWKLRGTKKALRGALIFAITLNNTGFIGLPFIRAALGDEAMLAAAMVEIANDIFIFTAGILILQYGRPDKAGITTKDILTPGTVSVVLGLIIFFLNIPIPDFIGRAFNLLGNATSAVSMFIIGAQLAEIKLSRLFTRKYVLESAAIRLIFVPLAVFAVLSLTSLDTVSKSVIILMFAMPTAGALVPLSRQYNADAKLAASCVMASTALLIVTLPVWMAVL